MDELIGNLKTYEMKRKKDSERREPKKEKHLVLKAESSDSSDEDSDMAYLTKEQYKQNPDKAGKRNLVPDKRFNRKSDADNIVKQDLATWGNSSSESERGSNAENSSMMAVETEATKYDSLFVLMAQSDDEDEEDEDDGEILTIELGEAEQSRDDLVVCVVDLNETIANLEQEKEALNERITSVENERDDLMVVVVDLKETIEGLNNEKHTLEEKVASTEEERDDLLVICTDLEETVEGLNREHMNVSLGKRKEVASESHILLEKKLAVVKTSLCSKLERNQQLQAELEKVRNDLEKSLKWTWSSDAAIAIYLNNSGSKQVIGFQREKTPYKPHIKYVTVSNNWLCTHYGNNGHFRENFQARVQSAQKNKVFTDRVTSKGPGRECILEKEVNNTFSVNEKVERFFRHSSGNEHYVNGLKCAVTNLITRQMVSMDKGNKNIHSY
ncbi:uncharacterized protein [Nicotiana sylvestris]|uniref:uncharacterized protein n=1 Tax=Nicotiana sylvestris TaxID=4096 RepID=UPI00388CD86F